MQPVDQQVVVAAQAGDWNKVESLRQQIYNTFWETDEGQQLLQTANREQLPQRLMEEFHRRFDGEHILPGVILVQRFVEIAQDILASEAFKTAPVPEVEVITAADEHANKVARLRAMMEDPATSSREVKALRESSVAWRKAWNTISEQDETSLRVPAREAVASPEETEQRKRLRQFAHCVNESVAVKGAGSISPKGGIVTLHVGGKAYEYPVMEFRAQLEQATIAGLIR